jgi:hypothetical protein
MLTMWDGSWVADRLHDEFAAKVGGWGFANGAEARMYAGRVTIHREINAVVDRIP